MRSILNTFKFVVKTKIDFMCLCENHWTRITGKEKGGGNICKCFREISVLSCCVPMFPVIFLLFINIHAVLDYVATAKALPCDLQRILKARE
jgi:hypothetical protein